MASINLAHMLDDADLHRHDLKLLTDLFADGVLPETAGAGQFMLRQLMNNFDAW